MGSTTVPQYIQPPADPALALLTKTAEDQRLTAAAADVAALNAHHALIYGTRMALAPDGTLSLGSLPLPGLTLGGKSPANIGVA